MCKKLAVVDKVMAVFHNLACDMDELRRLKDHANSWLRKLEKAQAKCISRKKEKLICEKIAFHRLVIGTICQAISAHESMRRMAREQGRRQLLKSVFVFFTGRINILKSFSHLFSHTFIGIQAILREMVLNASELKKLAAA